MFQVWVGQCLCLWGLCCLRSQQSDKFKWIGGRFLSLQSFFRFLGMKLSKILIFEHHQKEYLCEGKILQIFWHTFITRVQTTKVSWRTSKLFIRISSYKIHVGFKFYLFRYRILLLFDLIWEIIVHLTKIVLWENTQKWLRMNFNRKNNMRQDFKFFKFFFTSEFHQNW